MISINGRILENVYTTAQWAAITEVLPDRVFGYEVDGSGLPVGKKMGNGIDLWTDLPYWYVGGTPSNTVEKTINSGTVGPYLLTGPELAIVNSLGRIPNFVSLIGGVQYFDMYPIYTGTKGDYTQVRIELHGDPTPETVTVQFS